jgi:hypothetical protein
MRASVHVDLPGYTKEGVKILQARCEELHLQPRGKIFIFKAFLVLLLSLERPEKSTLYLYYFNM